METTKAGPSKNELKKAAKKAAKDAKKAAKKSGIPQASGTNTAAVGTDKKKAEVKPQRRDPVANLNEKPLLCGDLEGLEARKCLAVAKLCHVDLVGGTTPPSPLDSHPLAVPGSLLLMPPSPASTVIMGAHAICRYLISIASEGTANGADINAWGAADEWLEWDEIVLTPSLASLGEGVKGLPLPLIDAEKSGPEYLVDSDEYSLAYQFVLPPRAEVVGTPLTDLSVPTRKTYEGCLSALSNIENALECGGASALLLGGSDADKGLLTHQAARLVLACSTEAALRIMPETAPIGRLRSWVSKHAAALVVPPLSMCGTEVDDADDGSHGAAGIIEPLNKIFERAIRKAFPSLLQQGVKIGSVMRSKGKFGDYQCNEPMRLYKILKEASADHPPNPKTVATMIVDQVPANSKMISKCDIHPSGFINIHLAPSFLEASIGFVLKNGVQPPPVERKRKVVVDFSSPNIAKEMHVGHLRSTIIGDTICRTLEFIGHEVVRLNHVGDWGTQFGMLILHMEEAYPDFLTNPPNISDLTTFYKGAKKRFDDDDDFKTKARDTVVRLQSGDAHCREVWQLLCDISRKEFDKVYARLDVTVEERGESFYNSRIPAVVTELQRLKLIEDNDGAKVIFLKPRWENPLFLQKSDGGYGYDSTDMTAIKYRIDELGADWLVYVTDAGQQDHFYMCFEAARRAGWIDDSKHTVQHIGFGVVQDEFGKRFKTRSGETVKLGALLDEAGVRMRTCLDQRVTEGKCHLDPQDLAKAAAQIGYGAVKYFDLSNHPGTDYKFNFDKMLSVQGDTAVYLAFAHARLASIIRKAGDLHKVSVTQLVESGAALEFKEPQELALALELLQFTDMLTLVSKDLLPHRICEFLYKLSIVFTQFVTNCYVLGTAEMNSRILLCEATGRVMRQCFQLLGIQPHFRI